MKDPLKISQREWNRLLKEHNIKTLIEREEKEREKRAADGKRVEKWKERIAKEREILDWAQSLDKYLGGVEAYTVFKRGLFMEIDVSEYQDGRASKWVRVENNPEIDLLARLKDKGECVGFVHYAPLQRIGESAFSGGYGIPVKEVSSGEMVRSGLL